MADLQNDDVQLSNVSFYDVGNGNAQGCLQTEGNQVNLANVSCTNVGTYGLYDTNTLRLTGTELNFKRVSQVSGTQAIYLSTTATGLVNITNIGVNDTNALTYSSSIYDGSPSGNHGLVGHLVYGYGHPHRPHMPPTAQTTYTYSDAGHSFVFRNGGMIQSFVPPNYYFLPTAGATPTSYVNGAVALLPIKMLGVRFAADGVCWLAGRISHAHDGEFRF